jgi:hypothetical protein
MMAEMIIAELTVFGVTASSPEPGKLRLSSASEQIQPVLVSLAAANKAELLRHLRRCSPHNKPANYIDEAAPNRPGWIRSTCRECGAFIGYRPVSDKIKHRSG